jgi:phenylalanyl-tRNA synthetase beta chain
MRIPLNWLSKYVKLPENQAKLTDGLTSIGHMLDKLDKVNGRVVIDLELRGNRADCYSILGIAREVSAIFKTPVIIPKMDTNIKTTSRIRGIKLETESKYVQRVMMVKIDDVLVADSPNWLRESLEEYGIQSINNIVDLTNYVMVETGQPMHAFDLSKIGSILNIRLAKEGERITTFLDEQITLTNDDLVWANEDSVLSVAGAIGGKHHSISEHTKNVLLESASYNQSNIRRTVHRHNLLTDAGIRHEKELDPNLVEFGIKRFNYLLNKNGWGKIKEGIYDYYPKPVKPWKLSLNFKYLDTLSGFIIEKEDVKEILKRLNFEFVKEDKEDIELLCPTYRTDVVREEDLIEEVLRLYGYEKIPAKTLSLEIPINITPSFIKQEVEIKNAMASLGFDEVISIPFVKPKLQKYNKYLIHAYSPLTVINRPSPELEEMRMTIAPNIIDFVKKIIDERGSDARIFEIGKVYYQKDSKFVEQRVLGIGFWAKSKGDYHKFRGFLDSLFKLLRISKVNFVLKEISFIKNSYYINFENEIIGVGGQINDIHFVEIYLDIILGKPSKPKVNLWPKYPPQIEDLTVKIPLQIAVGKVISLIKSTDKIISDIELKDVYKKNYTFRIYYQDPDKTLSDYEIKTIREKVITNLIRKYRVTIIG